MNELRSILLAENDHNDVELTLARLSRVRPDGAFRAVVNEPRPD